MQTLCTIAKTTAAKARGRERGKERGRGRARGMGVRHLVAVDDESDVSY